MAMIIQNWLIGDTTIDDELHVLRCKKEALCARVDDINIQLEAEEMQPGRKRKRVVGIWLMNVEELFTEIQYFEQDVERGVYISNKKLKREVLSLTREIEDLMDQGKFPSGLTLDDHASSSVPLPTTNLKGRVFEENMNMILSWLINEDVCRVGIYGLGGVGKTTLAMHIHNKLLEGAKTSLHIYWVTVSKDITIAKLQNKIAKAAKVDHLLLQSDGETKRAADLFAALKKRKKIVLFLDDMWKYFEVENVGIPVGKDECKLVVTTRSLDVCRRMICRHRVKVEPLSEKESWELFTEKLTDLDDLSLEVIDVAKLVAKKCAGLPLGIRTIARSMIGVTDIHEWRSTLEELSNSMRRHHDMETDVYPILELSYARLNDVMLQNCFLNCALYPEDSKLNRFQLIDFWVADCLLEEIDSRDKQLDKGHTILNRLVNASLLESSDSEGKHVKMHDLIRDMAIKIGRETKHFMVRSGLQLTRIPDGREWTEDLIKVSLMSNYISEIESNVSPVCPNLLTLLLEDNPLKYVPDMFFLYMKGLRCLIITRAPMKKLPNSISELENLSSLVVSICSYLIYVPSLLKLVKLRELNLSFNDLLKDLPQGIDMLHNLRLLDLKCDPCAKYCVPFCSFITQLSHIEHLVLGCGIKDVESKLLTGLRLLKKLECWMSNVNEFNSYVKTVHFQQLKYYIIYISPTHSTHFQSFIDNAFIRSVVIHEYGENNSSIIKPLVLPNNIQFLQLIHTNVIIKCLLDIVQSFHGLSSLTRVWIGYCQCLEYVWQYASYLTEPRNLQELNLSELSNFRGLTKPGLSPSGALSNLRKLTMEYCHNIKTLFTPSLLNQLQNLEVLEVQVCTQLEEIMALSDFDEDARNNEDCEVALTVDDQDSTTIYLPKLRELYLTFLPNLVTLVSMGLLGCNNIEVITIIECPLLKKLPLFIPRGDNGQPSCAPVLLKKIMVQKQWWEEIVEWDHPDSALLLQPLIEFTGGT